MNFVSVDLVTFPVTMHVGNSYGRSLQCQLSNVFVLIVDG